MVVSAAARTAAAAQQRATTTKTRANRFEAPVTSSKQGMEARRLPWSCVVKWLIVGRVGAWIGRWSEGGVGVHASGPSPTESYTHASDELRADLRRGRYIYSHQPQRIPPTNAQSFDFDQSPYQADSISLPSSPTQTGDSSKQDDEPPDLRLPAGSTSPQAPPPHPPAGRGARWGGALIR